MRWGISASSSLNHQASSTCLSEVKNCLNDSIGPCFVTILSHRYGNRDLPLKIEENEFDLLKNEIKLENINLNFKFEFETININIENIIDSFYLLDQNEIPQKYRLQDINVIIQGYDRGVKN